MTWDTRAATIAQNWASQCALGQMNTNRNSQYSAAGGSGGLAESSAWGSSGVTLNQLVQVWIDQKSSYTCGNAIETTNFNKYKHYTQMVWGSTVRVGCGMATCNGQANLVCDYNLPGNTLGQTPFPAAQCSGCRAPATSVSRTSAPSSAPVPTAAPQPTPQPGDRVVLSESGSLSKGQTMYHPKGSYYKATNGGVHKATLSGSAGTDFDLYLFRSVNNQWIQVGLSNGATSSESVSYTGDAGYYVWVVSGYSGSGTYSISMDYPA
jgi:hypothetical protein